MTEHALPGLEHDNLLAWLAALGLLRSLERAEPEWRPRLFYTGSPKVAHLTVSADVDEVGIAEATARGCESFADAFDFLAGVEDLNFNGQDAVALREKAQSPEQAQVAAALFSEVAVRPNDKIDPTVLCAMFGQGHQHFVTRLIATAKSVEPQAKGGKGWVPLADPERLRRALFARWKREDPTEAFRWDYAEERAYALRADNPSGDKTLTEHGANRLAILGLISLTSAPVPNRRSVRLATRSVHKARRGPATITWPIWTFPASLAMIEMMLDFQGITATDPRGRTRRVLLDLGIVELRRVSRTSIGKMISFSRAECIPLQE